MNVQPNLASRLSSEGVNYAPEIVSAAQRHGLDPALLAAVAAQETGGPGSNGGRNIVGDGGHGRGLFQIDDRWHDFARSAAAMDPSSNAEYAAGMISGLLKRYGGDVHEALSAYNAGSPTATGTKTAWGDGSVLGYADSVLRHYHQIAHDEASGSSDLGLLQGYAQSASPPACAALPATPFTPYTPTDTHRSWAQMEGIDATGRTQQQTSYASLIDGDDDRSDGT